MHPFFLWFSGILIFIFVSFCLFVFRVSLLTLGPPGGFLCMGDA